MVDGTMGGLERDHRSLRSFLAGLEMCWHWLQELKRLQIPSGESFDLREVFTLSSLRPCCFVPVSDFQALRSWETPWRSASGTCRDCQRTFPTKCVTGSGCEAVQAFLLNGKYCRTFMSQGCLHQQRRHGSSRQALAFDDRPPVAGRAGQKQ